MKTLLVRDGDLDLAGGEFTMVTGADKLRQDLSHALMENFGNDRFHPRWGSMIPEYVGETNSETTNALLRAEVERVVSNYMVLQRAMIERDANQGRRPQYGSGEVISNLLGVVVTPGADWTRIEVRLQTMGGTEVVVSGGLSLATGEVGIA